MFNNLNIGLKGYNLLQVHNHKEIHVDVELRRELEPKSCPFCGASKLYSKGTYWRRVRHLDYFGKTSLLCIKTRRFLCTSCAKSFLPKLAGVLKGRHSSEPFRHKVYEEHHHGICASALARMKCIGHATVERIYQQFTKRKAVERISTQCPLYLGIDEHTLHKGQRFCTTFCDLKNHRVFEVQPGKSAAQLRHFLLTLKGREKVRMICIDLSSPYRSITKRYFPNAKIVADRFHVIRIIYHHFMRLAHLLVPELKHHRGSLAALRRAPERSTKQQQQQLHELFICHPVLKNLHHRMHQLRALMNHKHQTAKASRKLIKELLHQIDQLQHSKVKPMQTLASTLTSWIEPIACM